MHNSKNVEAVLQVGVVVATSRTVHAGPVLQTEQREGRRAADAAEAVEVRGLGRTDSNFRLLDGQLGLGQLVLGQRNAVEDQIWRSEAGLPYPMKMTTANSSLIVEESSWRTVLTQVSVVVPQ
jgi:hypothetical protein